MGNGCSSRKSPNYSPTCSPGPVQVDGFCTYASFLGTDRRTDACNQLGGAGEWQLNGNGVGDLCKYNDLHPSDEFDSDLCCGLECPIIGQGVSCQRKAGYSGYTAANTDQGKVQCCFQNYQFYANQGITETNLCLIGSATCPDGANGTENFQLMTGSSCQNITTEYCTGTLPSDDPTSTAWLARWDPATPNNCFTVLNQNLFNDPNSVLLQQGITVPEQLVQSRGGFNYSQTLISQVLAKYNQQGFSLGALPGYPGYNGFQDTVLQPICRAIPGLCASGLQLSCNDETTTSLIRNPNRVPWCGCYLSDDQYDKYVNEYQITKQCTPICGRQGNIPLAGPSGLGSLGCNQSVCIIDDTTINLAQTNVGGGVNFSQFCSGCSGNTQTGNTPSVGPDSSTSSCRCIIDNNSITAANSQIGGGINLTEVCGSTTCFRNNPDPQKYPGPPVLPVDCTLPTSYNPFITPPVNPIAEAEARYRRLLYIGIIVAVIIILILAIVLLSFFTGDSQAHFIFPHKSSPSQSTTITPLVSTPAQLTGTKQLTELSHQI